MRLGRQDVPRRLRLEDSRFRPDAKLFDPILLRTLLNLCSRLVRYGGANSSEFVSPRFFRWRCSLSSLEDWVELMSGSRGTISSVETLPRDMRNPRPGVED